MPGDGIVHFFSGGQRSVSFGVNCVDRTAFLLPLTVDQVVAVDLGAITSDDSNLIDEAGALGLLNGTAKARVPLVMACGRDQARELTCFLGVQITTHHAAAGTLLIDGEN